MVVSVSDGALGFFNVNQTYEEGTKMKDLQVKVTFIEKLLGTLPNDDDVYVKFIASKSPDAETIEDEVAALGVDEVVEKGMTVFPRTADGKPFLYDYQIKGFMKDACSMLRRLGKVNESGKLTAHKKVIDGLIFVLPRQIPIIFDGDIGSCQRPLRVETAQGPRVALANSEAIPAGAHVEFTIRCYDDNHVSLIKEWFEYGLMRGIGQWRNSGCGRFEYEILGTEEEKPKKVKKAA